MSLSALYEQAPLVNWTEYFRYAFNQTINHDDQTINQTSNESNPLTITQETEVVVYSPQYLADLSKLLTEYLAEPAKKVDLINYMIWSVVQGLTQNLSKPFREAAKAFRKALMGLEGSETQWRYCVSDTNGVMGFALAAMFVRNTFKGASRQAAEEMIDQIRTAFTENLPLLQWMDPETREKAIEKVTLLTD